MRCWRPCAPSGLTGSPRSASSPRLQPAWPGMRWRWPNRPRPGWNSSTGEPAAARWLDAEDAAVHQALTWALEHDIPTALRLAVALAPWWRLRGRSAAGRALLQPRHRAAPASMTAPGSRPSSGSAIWQPSQADYAAALGHFTAICDALAQASSPSRELADGLAGRSGTLRNLDRLARGHRRCPPRPAARPAGRLSGGRSHGPDAAQRSPRITPDDAEAGLKWARQAQQTDPAGIPGWVTRRCTITWALGLDTPGREHPPSRSAPTC